MTMQAKIEWISWHKSEIITAYADAYGSRYNVGIVWDDIDNIHIEENPYGNDADMIYEGREMDPIECRVMDNIFDADEWIKYTSHPHTIKTMVVYSTDAESWDEYRKMLQDGDAPDPLEIAADLGYDGLYTDIIQHMTTAERKMIEQVADDIIDYIIDEITRKEEV